MIIRILTLVALFAASNVLLADGPLKLRPGMMGAADIGGSDCALFNEIHPYGPTGLQHQVLTWTQGYIFAETGQTIDEVLAELPPGNGWDFDSLTGYIVDYCAENPEVRVSTAAVALWMTLSQSGSAPR